MYLIQVKAGGDWAPARIARNGVAHRLAVFETEPEAAADIAERVRVFDRAFPDGHTAEHRIVAMP